MRKANACHECTDWVCMNLTDDWQVFLDQQWSSSGPARHEIVWGKRGGEKHDTRA